MPDSEQPWYALNGPILPLSICSPSVATEITAVKSNTLTQMSTDLSHRLQQVVGNLSPGHKKRLHRLANRFDTAKGWFLGSLGLVLIWVWVWQWLLSLAIGATVGIGVYLVHQRRLNLPWQQFRKVWRQSWQASNRSLTLATLAGTVALVSAYLATAVWVESDQHWLATSILLEGLGIVAIGALLLWQIFRPAPPVDRVSQWLHDFSHTDPLKRLIAIRQATRAVLTTDAVSTLSPKELADYLRLMLDRETEAVVCNALIESLQQLQPTRQIEGTQLSSVTFRSPARTKVQEFSLDEEI